MAIKKYAYYLKGNKLALAQVDDVDNSSNEYGRFKSPTGAVTDGLELQYTYSPAYNIYSGRRVNQDKFYVSGWTVIGGYLAFFRSQSTTDGTGVTDWTASPYSAVTGGSEGRSGGQSVDYIVVEGSSRWNGLHKVQTAGTTGVLITYTKVGTQLTYFEDISADFAAADESIIGGGGIFLANHFTAGDYIFINDCSNSINNGLYNVESVTASTTASASKIIVGNRYFYRSGGDAIGTAGEIETEQSVVAALGDDDDEADINIYKAYRDPAYILTDVNVLNDEDDELDLTSYQSKALVHYLKAKVAEDLGDLKLREYYMKKFYGQLNRSENSKIHGIRRIMPSRMAIK